MAADQDRLREIALDTRDSLSQFDNLSRLVDQMDGSLALTPAIITQLHQIGMDGLHPTAGSFRTVPVRIRGSLRKPPDPELVAGLVEQMCDDVNVSENNPTQVAAFVLWKLKWIHPFIDGNGRTSRAVAYMALCVRLGYSLPGRPTIPEFLTQNRRPYHAALADADDA